MSSAHPNELNIHRAKAPELRSRLVTALSELAASRLTVTQLEQALAASRAANERMQSLLYGRKSERVVSQSSPLLPFDAQEQEAPPPPFVEEAPDDETEHAEAKERKKRTKRGIRRIPANIPRIETRLEPSQEQRCCASCNSELVLIGEERTELLDHKPASFQIQVLVRPKYACRHHEENGVVAAELPKRPIAKGMVTANLVAQIAVAKYRDHLPLHRQARIYLGHGVDISESTMGDWLKAGAELLAPLVTELQKELLSESILHSDDTSITVLGPNEKKTNTRRGFLWVYLDLEGNTLFHFTEGRSRAGPLTILKTYVGTLLSDAYSAYDAVVRLGKIVPAGCWAHARRRFHKAREEAPDLAAIAIEVIRRVFAVERKASEGSRTPESRLEKRRAESRPLLDGFRRWLEEIRGCVLPKSGMGEAVSYTLNQWVPLTRFLDNGLLPLENNAAERAMRQVAIGRKNWMFAGSASGGERAALYYSLVVGCKNLGIEPYDYLRDVLQRMAEDPGRASELTPKAWRAARRAAAATGA